MPTIEHILSANPLFAGGLMMAVLGWLAVQLKNAPSQLWGFVRKTFTTSLTTNNDEYIFSKFELFLAKHPAANKSRRFGVAIFENEDGQQDVKMTPGDGHHLIRHKGRFILISKETKDSSSKSGPDAYLRKSMTLTTFGRDRRPLQDLLVEVQKTKAVDDRVLVYSWGGHFYNSPDSRRKRPLDTIYIADDIKRDIIADIEHFTANADLYRELHIPHRRGYLLHGPPGTGKSSLIVALAAYFGKPIYLINPSNCASDASFLEAINYAGPSIVAIEDIDSCLTVHERSDESQAANAPQTLMPGAGVTLSGILNALDGIASKDGRILIMTTNKPELLDPALVRAGRVDRIFNLDHADACVASAMYDRFGINGDKEAFLSSLELPMSQAMLQNRLMKEAGLG